MLIQYQVAEDGRVSRISQVKLSVAGDVSEKGLQSIVWVSISVNVSVIVAILVVTNIHTIITLLIVTHTSTSYYYHYYLQAGPGIIAAACHEKMLRLFDLAADEAYNLSLSQLGQMVDRDDKVMCVSFSVVDSYLAVGK